MTFAPGRPRSRSVAGASARTSTSNRRPNDGSCTSSCRTRVYGTSCCSKTHRVQPASARPPHGSYNATRGSRSASRSDRSGCDVAAISRPRSAASVAISPGATLPTMTAPLSNCRSPTRTGSVAHETSAPAASSRYVAVLDAFGLCDSTHVVPLPVTAPRGHARSRPSRVSAASNGAGTSTTVTPINRPSVHAVMSYGRSMGAEGEGHRMSGYDCASSRSFTHRPNGCARRITAVPAGYCTPPAVNGALASSTSAPPS